MASLEWRVRERMEVLQLLVYELELVITTAYEKFQAFWIVEVVFKGNELRKYR